MKHPRLRRNASVGRYRVLEFVGEEEEHAVYTATKGDSNALYWLLVSDHPLDALADAQHESFQHKGRNYLAFPVEGTSVASLSQLVRALDWKFIVPRWAALAEQVGYHHTKGQLFQQGSPLDLNSILFTDQAQLLPLSFHQSAGGAAAFRAPEQGSGTPSPASDVFALGSALSYLLGGESPEVSLLKNARSGGRSSLPSGLVNTLKKATAPDPLKRFANASALAAALYTVSPRLKPAQVKPRLQINVKRLALILPLLLLLVAVAAVLAWKMPTVVAVLRGPTPVPKPTMVDTGQWTLEVRSVQFTPDRTGHIELRLLRAGNPIGEDVPIDFALAINGSPAPRITVDKLMPDEAAGIDSPGYRVNFDAPSQSSNTGTYQITARMVGTTLTQAVYYEDPNASANQTPAPGQTPVITTNQLNGVTISGLQVDGSRFPQLTLYFALSSSQGGAVRLQGPFTVQIEQDGQLVRELVMSGNDPSANPLTLALAMDVSGSMYGEPNANARTAGAEFVNALSPGDVACLYSFSTIITRVQECTADKKVTASAIMTMGASGNTALYDTLLSLTGDLSQLKGRKAIVLLSDGADTASKNGKESALSRVKQINVPIYAIGLVSYQYRRAVLQQFADETGGAFLQAPGVADLQALYAKIDSQLKNQYRIDFRSLTLDTREGTITVRLMAGGDKIETRHQFFVAK